MKLFILSITLLISYVSFSKPVNDSAIREKAAIKINPELYAVISPNSAPCLLSNVIFTIPTFARIPRLTLSGIVYMQRNPAFAEALVGPSYTSPFLEGGVMFGFQTEHPEIRIGPWMYLKDKYDRLYFWAYYEFGFDPSIRAEATWRLSRASAIIKLRTGLKLFEYNAGPTLNFERGKTYLSLAYIYGWNDQVGKVLTSIGWSLQ